MIFIIVLLMNSALKMELEFCLLLAFVIDLALIAVTSVTVNECLNKIKK